MKSTLDTHLIVVEVVLIDSGDVYFSGRIFSNSGHIQGMCLNELGLWVERQNSLFPNMKSSLDTHLRVVDVVLIVSEDV
jgi:hypothetical protein